MNYTLTDKTTLTFIRLHFCCQNSMSAIWQWSMGQKSVPFRHYHV